MVKIILLRCKSQNRISYVWVLCWHLKLQSRKNEVSLRGMRKIIPNIKYGALHVGYVEKKRYTNSKNGCSWFCENLFDSFKLRLLLHRRPRKTVRTMPYKLGNRASTDQITQRNRLIANKILLSDNVLIINVNPVIRYHSASLLFLIFLYLCLRPVRRIWHQWQ